MPQRKAIVYRNGSAVSARPVEGRIMITGEKDGSKAVRVLGDAERMAKIRRDRRNHAPHNV